MVADFLVVTADVSPPVAIYADDTLLVRSLSRYLRTLEEIRQKLHPRGGKQSASPYAAWFHPPASGRVGNRTAELPPQIVNLQRQLMLVLMSVLI